MASKGGLAVSLRDFRSGFVHHLAAPEIAWFETFLFGLKAGTVTWTLSFLLLVSKCFQEFLSLPRILKSKSHAQLCKRHRHCSPSTVKLQLVINVIINYLSLLVPLPLHFVWADWIRMCLQTSSVPCLVCINAPGGIWFSRASGSGTSLPHPGAAVNSWC